MICKEVCPSPQPFIILVRAPRDLRSRNLGLGVSRSWLPGAWVLFLFFHFQRAPFFSRFTGNGILPPRGRRKEMLYIPEVSKPARIQRLNWLPANVNPKNLSPLRCQLWIRANLLKKTQRSQPATGDCFKFLVGARSSLSDQDSRCEACKWFVHHGSSIWARRCHECCRTSLPVRGALVQLSIQ